MTLSIYRCIEVPENSWTDLTLLKNLDVSRSNICSSHCVINKDEALRTVKVNKRGKWKAFVITYLFNFFPLVFMVLVLGVASTLSSQEKGGVFCNFNFETSTDSQAVSFWCPVHSLSPYIYELSDWQISVELVPWTWIKGEGNKANFFFLPSWALYPLHFMWYIKESEVGKRTY